MEATSDLVQVPQKAKEQSNALSRRQFLSKSAKTAAGITLGGSALAGVYEAGKIVEKRDSRINLNEINHSEDEVIRGVEDRLSVRLVSLREAYQMLGVPFDEHDTKEFPQTLPMRWDHERALMLEEFFGYLPEYFHGPDGDGDPLVITLTNFPEHYSAAADYFPDHL